MDKIVEGEYSHKSKSFWVEGITKWHYSFCELKTRGCECDQVCPLCGEEAETIIHKLVTCPDAQWVWKVSPLQIDVNLALKCSFKEWCEHFANLIDDDRWWAMFWFVIWYMWLRINKWAFEGKKN